jgi:hypothetical protein
VGVKAWEFVPRGRADEGRVTTSRYTNSKSLSSAQSCLHLTRLRSVYVGICEERERRVGNAGIFGTLREGKDGDASM